MLTPSAMVEREMTRCILHECILDILQFPSRHLNEAVSSNNTQHGLRIMQASHLLAIFSHIIYIHAFHTTISSFHMERENVSLISSASK